MSEVHYEERDQIAVLQSEIEGEWVSSDAVVVLEDWV